MGYLVNTNETRVRNRKMVLDYVRANGPISSTDIARELGVPAGTIGRVTGSLLKLGFLKTAKPRKSNGVGKPPIMLDLNEGFALIAGIELNELTTKVVITDFKGTILSKKTTKTSNIQGDLGGGVADLTHSAIEEAELSYEALKGIGVGVSGNISPDGKLIMRGFLPHGLEIAGILERDLKLPVMVANDANLAVLAEKHFGEAKGDGNIVCLLDRGWVGAGLFLNNKLYTGSNNAAGELAAGKRRHDAVNDEDCVSSFPFIESYGLERQIEDMGFDKISIGNFPSREAFIKEIGILAGKGDAAANALIEGEATRFSTALYRLAALFDPDLLVITGDIASAGECVERMIKEKFEKAFSLWSNISPARFAFSKLNQSGVALGAVSMAMEELSKRELI